MGADMISQSMAIPVTKFMQVLKARISEAAAALELAECCTLASLRKAGFDVMDYEQNSGCELDYEELVNMIRMDLDSLATIQALDHLVGRDTSWCELRINGCSVRVYYAGGTSWGDEPEGHGYTTLNRLWRTGVGAAMHNAIPWDAR